MKVGLVGCGNIAPTYVANLSLFADVDLVACSDANNDTAKYFASRHGLGWETVEGLIARDDIEVVLNLTPPDAHAEVLLAALSADKHVYTEKPLATSLSAGKDILTLAKCKGKRVGAAPDSFLGAGAQAARALVDNDEIGVCLSGVAAYMSHGMEHWHPSPDAFYKPGAGPLFDKGPYYLASLVNIVGPVSRVSALGKMGFMERTVSAPGSPKWGESIRVETLTHIQAMLEFHSGVQVTMLTSWDVWKHGMMHIELHGTKGSLRLPDPNMFGDAPLMAKERSEWIRHDTANMRLAAPNWPVDKPIAANYRGAGLADMVQGIMTGRPHRANGEVALHLLAVMTAMIESARANGVPCDVAIPCQRPDPLGERDACSLFRLQR